MRNLTVFATTAMFVGGTVSATAMSAIVICLVGLLAFVVFRCVAAPTAEDRASALATLRTMLRWRE